MSLKEYKSRRDFLKTSEPKAQKDKTKNEEKVYVIQKHNASHLHYDLRLEFNGTLKSWAIPKQPPKIKHIKRLAIQTEDHPISYAEFEGEIPKGNYGAGTVEIWDKGTFETIENNPKTLVVNIKGKKLRGEYCLIKINYGSKPEKSWLFFKR